MCNVFEVAKKICEAGNWEITNLQLQKNVIYCTGFSPWPIQTSSV